MIVSIGQISLIVAFIVTFYSSIAGFYSGAIKNSKLFNILFLIIIINPIE